ncbi:nuclear envelope [Piedraia hortae CBS 480.64]|uniref:Tethering factor for nuclear proteasome STS1 n=1 Tax=Piedraia hortae CBS 480.64 TaxID=1314780 RepID=A0A6A7CAX0_9PEZI|nr:nuclear envelope [Piedraia hortae CBS 480.64]
MVSDGAFAPHLLSRRSPAFPHDRDVGNAHRKRKASEDRDDRMSTSPTASPAMPHIASSHRTKRLRMAPLPASQSLPLNRVLESLPREKLTTLVLDLCETRQEFAAELANRAPRPTVDETMTVLSRYERLFRDAIPKGNVTPNYAFGRTRHQLTDLITALHDYTSAFIPPRETQPFVSLSFLDAATNLIHSLPNWNSYEYMRLKNEAYGELAGPWAVAVVESAKKAAGYRLQFEGWDEKLLEHNAKTGGRFTTAVAELESLGFGTNASSTVTRRTNW